ncbi:MAG: ABC transporter permease, partial [Candidatus Paceibacterota bacterium]
AVPTQGSIVLLLILTLPFIAANLAVGLTFSTLASNQLQAVQGAMFFFLPSILLSGFMFPFRGMPEWAQWVTRINPVAYFIEVMRMVVLKGSGLSDIKQSFFIMLIYAIIINYWAVVNYRKRA